jgi:beta-glucosidase
MGDFMKLRAIVFSILIACFSAFAPAQQTQSATPPSYKDPSLPTDRRVDDLISRMTLEEKVSQLGHTSAAIPRLGVPAYNWWNEGLHGVARAGYATVFPQAIGMAATFDDSLMHDVADVISTEFRAKYYATLHPDGTADWYRGLTAWSPNINIFRDPRWGRGQETYGEDPYLTSRIGIAFVTGLQGNDPKYIKVVSTPKHFAVHSGPESTRHFVNINPTPHDLQDTYLPAFRATVTEAKAESVMCAYNAVDGAPACANTMLLDQYLRKDWGFKGYVVSDCGAAADIFGGHKYKPNAEEGVAAAFTSGMDVICGDYRNHMSTEPDGILGAVHHGLLPEATIDQALRRLFSARFRLGMFDPPASVPYSKITPADNDTPAHRQLALRMAQESIVLLKNENGLLPLKQEPKTIAVVGPNATNLDALVGNYNGTPSHPVNVLEGIRTRFPKAKVTYVEGVGLVGPAMSPVPTSALCAEESCKKHGLTAEYFSNQKLEGTPKIKRIDRNVDRVADVTTHSQDFPDAYSARWTGFLVAPESGDFTLGFTGQDGYRVSLDDKVIAEDWTDHEPATTVTAKLPLEKNHKYSVKIEFFQRSKIGNAQFVWSTPSQNGQDAVEAARKSDLVVIVGGLSPRIEGEEMKVQAEGFSGGDRTKLDLPAPQEQLLKRIQATGKPLVFVLMNGSAVAINWADEHVPAIVEAWYPGEEGGTAVAGLLAGDFNPGGRLPVTFYKSVDQLPPFDDYSMAKRTYRYFDGEPLYPFGYGLSFTKFEYGNVHADKSTSGNEVTVSVDVVNAADKAGDEVVQLYLTHPGVAGAPIRALKGFKRVHLDPAQKQTVQFTLHDRDLSTVDESGQRKIVPGAVQVWIGGGQPIGRTKPAGMATEFTLDTPMTLPD